MLNKLISYLLGYVKFSVSGPFCERFINLCGMHNRDVWDIKKQNETIICFTKAREYKNLRVEARKSGSKINIIKKYGLPFIVYQNRHRYGILVGLILSAFIVFNLSGYVWNIEIYGNSSLPTEVIENSLSEYNVYVGMKKKNLDPRNITEGIMAKYDGISWMSINPTGTTLCVNISERTEPPGVQNNSEPCHIVAKCDGVIQSIKVTEGRALVKVGDAVVKGDVLISGIVEYSNGSVVMKQARGDVVAVCEEIHTVNVPLKREIYVETGEKKVRSVLHFFNLNIPLYIGELDDNWDKIIDKNIITIDGVKLPYGITKGTFIRKIKKNEIISTEKAIELGKENIKEKMKIHSENSEIKLLTEKIEQNELTLKLTQKYSVTENIGISEKVLIF